MHGQPEEPVQAGCQDAIPETVCILVRVAGGSGMELFLIRGILLGHDIPGEVQYFWPQNVRVQLFLIQIPTSLKQASKPTA